MTRLFAHWALLPEGWARDVLFEVAAGGTLSAVRPGSPREGATLLNGPVLPGMPNAHSHVAQRALAGRTEGAGPAGDSFWSWRETMYAFVEALDPDAFEALAAWAFAEMLEAGYTSVAEFHYLHHGAGGARYDNPAEMAERVLAAARSAGIGLTLLPTLYRFSDAGGVAPAQRQRRFICDPGEFVALWESLAPRVREGDERLGVAFHSLRAVAPGDIVAVLSALGARAAGAPLHVHVSEQTREIEAVCAAYGETPIALLARTVELGPRWSLVHATHATPAELRAIAGASATVVVAPTTEANLGDGIFPLESFRALGGRIAVGSDSNVTLDVAEELRWLEYVQRLATRKRHVFAVSGAASLADGLYGSVAAAGRQSLGNPGAALAAGGRADLVVLDGAGEGDAAPSLDRRLFAGAWRVSEVVRGGVFVVRDGAHVRREELRGRARQAARAMRFTID